MSLHSNVIRPGSKKSHMAARERALIFTQNPKLPILMLPLFKPEARLVRNIMFFYKRRWQGWKRKRQSPVGCRLTSKTSGKSSKTSFLLQNIEVTLFWRDQTKTKSLVFLVWRVGPITSFNLPFRRLPWLQRPPSTVWLLCAHLVRSQRLGNTHEPPGDTEQIGHPPTFFAVAALTLNRALCFHCTLSRKSRSVPFFVAKDVSSGRNHWNFSF